MEEPIPIGPKGILYDFTVKAANMCYNDSTIKQRILGDYKNPALSRRNSQTTLESGQLDAVAAYKHEAISRGLPYISLLLRLTSPIQRSLIFIEKASYTLTDGHRVFGGPIYFSATIPGNSQESQMEL